MNLILNKVIKNKTVWRSVGPFDLSDEVPTSYYGYKNKQGKWIIKPEYEFATEFSSGIAIVAAEEDLYDGYGYEVINEKGEFLFSINKNAGSDVPVGKRQSIRELKYVYDVEIKDALIIVSEKKYLQNASFKGNYALVNKVGEMVTDYVFRTKKNISISDAVMLAKQVQVAGSKVLNWGTSSLFLSEQNVNLFKENLKHYLVKASIDQKLNKEQIKTLAREEKTQFNEIVNSKQQEVLKAPICNTKQEKEALALIENELKL